MRKKFLLAIIFIIILLVGGLGYYKYIYNGDINNNQVKLSREKMDEVLNNFPYEALLDGTSKKAEELSFNDQTLIVFENMSTDDMENTEDSDIDCENLPSDLYQSDYYKIAYNYFKQDKKYYFLNKYYSGILYTMCNLKKFGFKEADIEAIGPDNGAVSTFEYWEKIQGGMTANDVIYMFDDSIYDAILLEKTGVEKEYKWSSFSNLSNCDGSIIYDDILEKYFYKPGYTCGGSGRFGFYYFVYINDGYQIDDEYYINIGEGILKDYDIPSKLVTRMNKRDTIAELDWSLKDNEVQDILRNNYSKLDHYQYKFKKVGDNYQFVSLEYID